MSFTNSNFNQNYGNIIFNDGNLSFTNLDFIETQGKVISYNNGNITLTNSDIIGSNATYGGIISNSGNITFTNSDIIENNASSGGIIDNSGNITFTNSNIIGNNASSGEIISNSGNITFTNLNITRNNADYGIIYTSYGNINFINSNITENFANDDLITNSYGNFSILNSTLTNNNAENWLIYNYKTGILNIIDSNLTQNNATYGGVIHNEADGNVNITNSNFIQNNATYGGVIDNEFDGYVNITNSNFIQNNATYGGVIYNNETGDINITNSNFTQNNATTGGAIYNKGNLIMDHLILTDNFDSNNIVIYSITNFTLSNSIIINNMGKINTKVNNTFISPIINENLDSNENINFNIENKTYTTTKDTENHVKTIQSVDNPGKLPVTIEYPSYAENNTIKLIYNVMMSIQNITLPTQTIPSFTNTTIETTLKDIDGNLLEGEIPATIRINNKTYTTTIKDGILNTTIPTETLEPGEYTTIIEIPETEKYVNGTITQNIIITKRSIQQTTIPENTIPVFTDTEIDTTLTDTNNTQLKGEINATITVNGEEKPITITNGVIKTTLTTNTLNAGEYTITINIPESTNYNSATITQKITITKQNIQQTTIPENTIPVFTDTEKDTTLTDTNNTQLKGEINATITVNGEEKTVTIVNGVIKTTLTTSTLNAGKYTITINIPESTNYNAKTITQNLTILKRDIQQTTLSNSSITTYNNKTINIVVNDTLYDTLKGEILSTIKLNDKNITTTIIKDGIVNVVIPTDSLSAGEYIITIEIPETQNYNNGIITQKLTINKRDIQNITLPDSTILTLTNGTIFLIIKDTQGDTVKENMRFTVKINGATQLHSRTNKEILNVTLPTDKFRNPTYQMTIIIGNNNFYNQGIITQTINMQKRNVNISMQTNTPQTFKNIELNITVTENNIPLNDGFLIFKINETMKNSNGEQIRENVINGKAQLKYTLPSTIGAGKYNISVYYINPYYNKQMCIENLTIIQSNIENKTLDNIQVIKGTNTTITIIVNDTDGNQIQGKTSICIKFNKKTLIHTNITNGIINVTLPTDNFRNPTYQITIVLGKNSLYNRSEFNGTIIVQPQEDIRTKNGINMTITP